MIVVDTDILSALAKVGRLPLLFALFQVLQLHIPPAVLEEAAHGLNLGRSYAKEVFALLSGGQLQVVSLTQAEVTFRDSLSHTLGAGERESIAIAKERGGYCTFQ